MKRLTDAQIAALEDREAVAAAREQYDAMRADLQSYGRKLAARDNELAAELEARAALEGLSPQAVELLPGVAKTFGAVL